MKRTVLKDSLFGLHFEISRVLWLSRVHVEILSIKRLHSTRNWSSHYRGTTDGHSREKGNTKSKMCSDPDWYQYIKEHIWTDTYSIDPSVFYLLTGLWFKHRWGEERRKWVYAVSDTKVQHSVTRASTWALTAELRTSQQDRRQRNEVKRKNSGVARWLNERNCKLAKDVTPAEVTHTFNSSWCNIK